ncbi:hypothetical protein B0H13DRAFT_2363954 [Mycena leptocephala]|nr:hypothetical protein B0H13DRAFT_2363954 [Mycena leptocephala]
MSTFDASLLTSAEAASVRALHKSVCATQYEDPVDQDTFLVASALSVLELQPQVASFALTPDIGECVFAIRSKMLQNNLRLHTPPDATFALITDFASEIVRKWQLFREHKRAQDARLSGAKAAANRAEHRCALRCASGEPSASSDSDAVSIPSDNEDASAHRQPTPIVTDTKTLPTPAPSPIHVRLIASLSPLTAIETLLIALALSSPIQPLPISPNPSLPDLVPLSPPSVVRLRKDPHPMEGKMTDQPRGCITTRTPHGLPTCPETISLPTLVSPTLLSFNPLPFGPSSRSAGGSNPSKQRSTASLVHRNSSAGSFNRARKPVNRKPVPPRVKHCYFCAATTHLYAACPFRKLD